MDDLLIILGSVAAAFTAGMLFAAAILLGRAGPLIARIRSKLCSVAIDDEREHSPWRHM